MRTLITLAIAAILAAVGAVAFAYSGLYDVSARTPHSEPVNWLLSKTSQAAVERRAASIEVPDLSAESLVRSGINDYEAMCVGCHGAPGQEPTPLALGLNPPAPDLSISAQVMSPAELFWVTKHGIKMTGMPAWGASHDDASLWPVVALITQFPDLDAAGYREYLEASTDMGHHAPDTASGSDDHGEPGRTDEPGHKQERIADGDDQMHESDASDDHHDGHDHEH